MDCKRRTSRILTGVALLATFCLVSCGTMQHWTQALNKVGRKQKKDAEKPRADVYVGEVESVNPDGHFVLIHHSGVTDVSVGAVLVARAKGAASDHARVKIGPERKQNFLSADIVSGSPRVGDSVFLPATPATGRPATFTMSPVDRTSAEPPGPPMGHPGSTAASRASQWQQVQGPPPPDGMIPGVAPAPGAPPPSGTPGTLPGTDLPPPVR